MSHDALNEEQFEGHLYRGMHIHERNADNPLPSTVGVYWSTDRSVAEHHASTPPPFHVGAVLTGERTPHTRTVPRERWPEQIQAKAEGVETYSPEENEVRLREKTPVRMRKIEVLGNRPSQHHYDQILPA